MNPTGRPLHAVIDLNALRRNAEAIAAAAGKKKIIAVVKDNAYGHGARRVVPVIDDVVDYYGVGCGEEARQLRDWTKKRFILFGGLFGREAEDLGDRVIPVVHDFAGLEEIQKRKGNHEIEFELDTGMGRTGFLPGELNRLAATLAASKSLRVHGIMTHFASSDDDRRHTMRQLRRFTESIGFFKSRGILPGLVHAANSAGIFYNDGTTNAVRPGIMLYGGYPAESLRRSIVLAPVMTFTTKVIALKRVPKGTPVSYGRTFVTARPSVIATLAAGYGDGYPRHLSNKGIVYVVGRGIAPVAGRVTMDMTMIDVTDLPGVRPGDDVVLWGAGHEAVNPDRVAAAAGTISYELFCRLSGRVRRVYRRWR